MNFKRTWLAAALVISALMIPLGVLAREGGKLDPRVRIAVQQLRSGATAQDLKQRQAAVTAAGDLDVFITGNVSRGELEAAGAVVRTEFPGGIFTAFVPVDALEAIEALPGVDRIKGAVVYEENLNVSLPTTMADIQRAAGPGFAGANGAGVLVGDIDSGISYAHGDFDDNAGNTRIYRIWDQLTATGPAPSGYTYGTEYLPAAIDANTAQGKDTNGHGTHVMGIAAGDGSLTGGSIPAYTYVGMAPMASIVEIKSDYTDTHIADGAAYFFGLATAAGMNAVLNISLGSNYGPHDGGEPLSLALDALVAPGHAICVSSGNNGGTTTPLQHWHASCVATYPTAATTILTLAGTNAINRIVGVDGYYDNLDQISVTVSHPTYGSFGPYALGVTNATYPGVQFGTGTTKGYLYVENGAFYSGSGDPEVYCEIRGGSTSGSTLNGNWTFTFTPTAASGPMNGRVDIWRFYVSSTLTTANWSGGIDDTRLLGGDIATANNVITCGSWTTKTSWTNCANLGISYSATVPPTTVGLLSSFSSNGPTRDGRMKPEIAAPGQGIGSTMTQDVSLGTCTTTSTYYSYLNDNMKHWINQGTSMAAPHVTGAVALLFQKFGPLTKAQIMQKLTALALVDGNTGIVPNNSWGAGKLRVDVTNPNVAVLYPNGAEAFTIGTPENLTWSAADPIWSGVASVDVQLSRDGGANWEDLALSIPNSGTFAWNPTGPATVQALVRVRAHDVADNIGQDVSDAVFSIAEAPVAVEMSLFKADNTDAGVRLQWKLADPSRYSDVWAERSNSSPWSRLEAPVASTADGFMTIDASAEAGVTYSYRIAAKTTNGTMIAFAPISITAASAITEFSMGQVRPNPTKANASVSFSVPRSAHIAVKVFDVGGRLMSTLVDANYTHGVYQATWDGRTRTGETAPNGVYFMHFVSPTKEQVQRVTLVR